MYDQSLSAFDQFKFIVVLTAIFCLPTRGDWFRYYTLINCIVPLILIDFREFKRDAVLIWLIVWWGFFFVASTLFKSYFIPGIDVLREFTELARIFIFIPLLLIHQKYLGSVGFRILSIFLAAFVVINSYMVLAETKFLPKNGLYIFIETNYHFYRQVGLSYLAKGTFSHGALNALMMNCIVVFNISTFKKFRYPKVMLLITLLAIFNMFAGGSRTNMVAIAFFIIVFFSLSILKENKKTPPLLFLIPLVLVIGGTYLISLGLFGKLQILLDTGTNTSSVVGRQINWLAFLKEMDKYWYVGIIGWGKTMFIKNGSSFFTDNDYFTYLIVHGLISFTTILFLMAKKIVVTFYYWTCENEFGKCLFHLILLNLLISTSSAGFSYPMVLIFITLVYLFDRSEKRNGWSYSKN